MRRNKSLEVKGGKFRMVQGQTKLTCDLPLTELNDRLQLAQYALDSQIMADMVPYMPLRTGGFIQRTTAESAAMAGTGQVCAAAAPFGRFLYEGKVMVDPVTGSTWAAKGRKKVLVSQFKGKTKAKEDIEFLRSAHPGARKEWFDAAKREHMREWTKLAQEVIDNG